MPFTNGHREGFENRIADLLAADLGADIRYDWRPQRRGFFRVTLKEDEADLVLGVPSGFERALTTIPYYRSSYVFASRKGRAPAIDSFDDPTLRRLRIGVQLVGDDGINTPPAHSLAARGLATTPDDWASTSRSSPSGRKWTDRACHLPSTSAWASARGTST